MTTGTIITGTITTECDTNPEPETAAVISLVIASLGWIESRLSLEIQMLNHQVQSLRLAANSDPLSRSESKLADRDPISGSGPGADFLLHRQRAA